MAYILVVDDDWMNREIIETYLQTAGYEVVAVNSGAKALAIATERPPALVILDLNMPGMNGFEVCQQLKAHVLTCFSPVMVVSGRENEDDMRQALAVGADDFLIKPFNSILVLARVKSLVRLYQLATTHTRTVFYARWQTGATHTATALVQQHGGKVEMANQAEMLGFFPVIASTSVLDMLNQLQQAFSGVTAGIHTGEGIWGTLASYLCKQAPSGAILLTEAVVPYVQHRATLEPFAIPNMTVYQVK